MWYKKHECFKYWVLSSTTLAHIYTYIDCRHVISRQKHVTGVSGNEDTLHLNILQLQYAYM